MAIMIPDVDPSTIEHGSERDVYVALRDQLDQRYIVLHSYPWLRLWRGSRHALLEGEADFVVAHPDRGILVLEVKGGEVYEKGRRWFRSKQTGDEEITNPFEQARRNMHALVDIVADNSMADTRSARQLQGGRDYVHGYAVVFPHLVFRGTLPADADRAIVISLPDLVALAPRVEEAFQRWTSVERRLDPPTWLALQQALMPRFSFYRPLGLDVQQTVHQIHMLTEVQSAIYLRLLEGRGRLLVTGPAGSGKTMLALEQARHFAAQGQRTLLCCFNKELAAWLREIVDSDPEAGAWRELLVIRNFHALAAELARRAGVPFEPRDELSSVFWNDEVPDIVSQAVSVLEETGKPRFDVVVVDEAQDFLELWWYTLTEDLLAGADAPLHAFMDPEQCLWGRPEIPSGIGLSELLSLDTNCRNTKQVARTSARILGLVPALFKAAPEGTQPQIMRAPSATHQRGIVENAVRRLLGDLAPRQIAVIGPATKANSCLAACDSIGEVPLTTSAQGWRRGEGVLVTTARAFKGLEADAVVVYDLGGFSSTFRKQDLYVACTRARHTLVLVTHDDAMRGELARCCAAEVEQT